MPFFGMFDNFENRTVRSISGPSCSSSPTHASSCMACLSGVSSLMVLTSFVCMRSGHLSGQAIKFCERVALERILTIWKKKLPIFKSTAEG